MSGRSKRSEVRPLKRTSPFSKKTARSASCSATLTDCSTTMMVVPAAWSSFTTSMSWATMVGARPSDSSSIIRTRGRHHQGHGQGQHLLLAAGEVAGLLVGPVIEDREELDHPLLGLVDGPVVLADHPGAEPQVLVDGQGREDAPATGHQGQAHLGDGLGRFARDGPAAELDRAAADPDQARGPLEQGRLAGPVGAEQGHDLALVHVEVDAEEDLHRAVGDLDLLAGQDHRRVGGRAVGRGRDHGDLGRAVGRHAPGSPPCRGWRTRHGPARRALSSSRRGRARAARTPRGRAPERSRPGGRPPGWAPRCCGGWQ